METIDPRGVAKFDPRGMIGTIYIQNIEAMGSLVSEKKIYLVFPGVSLWRQWTPGAWPNLTPRGTTISIYIEDH